MHALILAFLLAAPAQPLKVYTNIPPMARNCAPPTMAAVRYNKDNVEHAACYKPLACEDGTAYGTGACVCRPGMPLLDQDGVVNGCTAKAPVAAEKVKKP